MRSFPIWWDHRFMPSVKPTLLPREKQDPSGRFAAMEAVVEGHRMLFHLHIASIDDLGRYKNPIICDGPSGEEYALDLSEALELKRHYTEDEILEQPEG